MLFIFMWIIFKKKKYEIYYLLLFLNNYIKNK